MNFGLASEYASFGFQELCSDEIEIVSGGSGGGGSILPQSLEALAGGIIAVGGGFLMTESASSIAFAAGIASIGLGGTAVILGGAVVAYMVFG